MPHKHYVNMTPAVAECRSKMYAELHGGKSVNLTKQHFYCII
jgi:hypothetical protein